MKHLFVICALAISVASCATTDTTNMTESSDSVMVTATAPVDTVLMADSTVTVSDSIK